MTKENDIRNLILKSNDLPIIKIKTPEWGTDVYMRSMNVAEKNNFLKKHNSEDKEKFLKDFDVKLLVQCLYSDKDATKRIFKDSDATALKKKSSVVVNRCLEEARNLNALGGDKTEALEKN